MLIACLACGKRISDRAPACPFCGTKASAPVVTPPHLVEQIQDARQKIQELKPA